MKNSTLVFLLSIHFCSLAQNDTLQNRSSNFIGLGFYLGKTFKANVDFPETKLFTDFELLLGKVQRHRDKEWAYRLKYPKTGLSFSFSDFGNSTAIGKAYTFNTFIEFGFFNNKSKQLFWNSSAGIGYFNRQFDLLDNPFNMGITTKLNFSFKTSVHYDLLETPNMNLRAGISLIHYSNGHGRLPNQGLNTLAFKVSSMFGEGLDKNNYLNVENEKNNFEVSKQFYFSFKSGVGRNVMSRIFNDKKEVYTTSASVGKIFNKTFKLGVGAHFRFYEHYYDYINNNEELVQERFASFKEHPFINSSNFGVFASGELLLGHMGAEFDVGINFFKPAYKIDWILNEGETFSTGGENPELVVVLGELNNYFKLKRAIPTRLGLKYYLINNRKTPKHNIYLGAHINANLGQADFSEVSLGYVRRFNLNSTN